MSQQQCRHLLSVLIALAAIGPFAARAQQPAAGPAPIDCVNPGDNPPDRKSESMKKFNKAVDDYKVCVNAYAKENGAKAVELSTQAKAYMDAANQAISGYNQYVAVVNANNEKANDEATKKK